jgi:hypothetical protein
MVKPKLKDTFMLKTNEPYNFSETSEEVWSAFSNLHWYQNGSGVTVYYNADTYRSESLSVFAVTLIYTYKISLKYVPKT